MRNFIDKVYAEHKEYLHPLISITLMFFALHYFTLTTTNYKLVTFVFCICSVFVVIPLWRHSSSPHSYVWAKDEIVFTLLWYVFVLTLALSELKNGRTIDFIPFAIVIPALYWFVFSKSNLSGSVLIHVANAISSLPFVIVTFFFSVRGHEYHTNGIGLLIITAQVSWQFFTRKLIQSARFGLFLVNQLIVFACLVGLASIRIRGALLAAILLIWLDLMLNVLCLLKSNKPIKHKIPYFVFYSLLTASFLVLIVTKFDYVKSLIFKYGISTSIDISSSRFQIWRTSLEYKSLLGRGYSFFINNNLRGPHNIFIGLLGYFGLLACVSFFLWIVFLIYIILKRKNNSKMQMKCRAFLYPALTFFVAGQFEGFLNFPVFRPINLIFLITAFIVALETKQRKIEPLLVETNRIKSNFGSLKSKNVLYWNPWLWHTLHFLTWFIFSLLVPDKSNIVRVINQFLNYLR